MRIKIIGGGPAGLYFALLMKKSDPAREVTVMERNAPDDTFGWGVVFSDKTLFYLEDSDQESCARITEKFETWDNVDVVHKGERITIRGNKFSGIERIELLNILQKRCRELGVELRFNCEVPAKNICADADLVVGADGVNSLVRQTYGEFFQPILSAGENKYIWYGTHQLFHGLTLTFRQTQAGVFAAHSYKFNKTTSTFIVECDAETWRRARFESMTDEATRRYLREVFADDLNNQELLSNNSKWINFVNVSNSYWSHRNLVLLGDALHTAHFSIGSGTKLALEDAIALHKCFETTRDSASALHEFERMRKPVIEAYQEAAHESRVWFEHAKDYMPLDPLSFAFELMTRSKKIDRENLRRRDPQFVAAYDNARQFSSNSRKL